jgi:hypothetical protein
MHIANLQFRGLKNTQIDASGSLATNNDPNKAGATLRIRRLHTNQTDIALFTGRRLSNERSICRKNLMRTGQLRAISIIFQLATINSSVGTAFVNGRFTKLGSPQYCNL